MDRGDCPGSCILESGECFDDISLDACDTFDEDWSADDCPIVEPDDGTAGDDTGASDDSAAPVVKMTPQVTLTVTTQAGKMTPQMTLTATTLVAKTTPKTPMATTPARR